MPIELRGALALRKALRMFTDDLAVETQKELAKAMAPVARRARGFIPSQIDLSGWQKGTQKGKWESRAWSASEARDGIGYSTQPSRPNRNGFTTLARIVNASAAGAIYETAGRKNPEGRKRSSQVTVHKSYYSYEYTRTGTNKESGSRNPWAGAQFIDALNEQGLIVDANSRTGAGRRGRKMKGRAIFRAWKEDGGKTKAAVEKAIEASRAKFLQNCEGQLMANEAPLNINVKAVFTGKKAFKEADTATTKLAKGAGKLAGALGIAFSTRAILNYSKAAMKAAAQDQEAQAVLSQNLKNLGLAYANVDSEGFIASLEKQTAILDDELRPAYAKLARATGSIGKTQKIMKVAFDAAKGSGQSYNAVIETLSQAYVGNQKGLKKLNLGFTAAELSAMSFDEVLQVITEHFNGAGTKALEGYAGKLAKLDLASKNASETIGGALLDAFSQLAGNGDIDKATSKIDTFSKGAADLIRYLSGAKNIADAFKQVDFNLMGGSLVTDKRKNGGALGAPGAMANQTAAKKAEKAALDRAKKLAEINKKTNKLAGDSLKLAKAKAVFDLQKIQIEAALKGKISEEERARLLLLKAIENENTADIDKYTKSLDAARAKTKELQDELNAVKEKGVTSPFVNWPTSLNTTQDALTKFISSAMIKFPSPFDEWFKGMSAAEIALERFKESGGFRIAGVNAGAGVIAKDGTAGAGGAHIAGGADANYDAILAAAKKATEAAASAAAAAAASASSASAAAATIGGSSVAVIVAEANSQAGWAGLQTAWNRSSRETF